MPTQKKKGKKPIKKKSFLKRYGSRRNTIILVALLVIVGGYLAVRFSRASSCTVSDKLVPSCGAYWGAFVPGNNIPNLEAKVGRKFAMFQSYHDFSATGSGAIPSASDKTLMSGGRILLASWQTREYATGTIYTWASVAAGNLDASRIIPQAQRIKALGSTKIFLSFGPEMDGHRTQYGTAADYVAAYRHIHDVFAAQGVTNVVWVWTPAGYNLSIIPSFYPGDSYVDWVGYDPYNFYGCQGYTTWYDSMATIKPFYNWVSAGNLGAGAATKPMMLPEYGSHDDPANPTHNQAWYTSLPTTIKALPRIKAVAEFDDVGVCDSRVDGAVAQPATLAGFTTAGHDPAFNQIEDTTVTVQPPPPPTPDPTPTPTPTPTYTAGPIIGIANKCLDNYANKRKLGNPITLFSCNQTDAQTWTVKSNGTIVNKNGFCLDVTGNATASGTPVQLWKCNGLTSQTWVVNSSTGTIINPHSGLCLDDYAALTKDGNKIQVWTCNGTAAQKWYPKLTQ